jgi:arylsulfatase A-like enzyme
VTGRSRALPALALLVVALAGAGCRRGPTSTVYDLAADAPIAEWISPDGVRVTASPVNEIDHRLPRSLRGRADLPLAIGSVFDVRLFLTCPEPGPRVAVLRLEWGPSAVAVAATLNRTSLGRIALREGRHTYRLALPGEQITGLNALRLTFEAQRGSGSLSGEPLQGAIVLPAGDPAAETLVGQDLPPIEVVSSGERPGFRQWAGGRVRYALRLPERAELHLGVSGLAGAAKGARYEVSLQPQGGPERRIATGVVPGEGTVREESHSLPGREGDFVWISLGAETGPDGLARVQWVAPRVSGASPPSPAPKEDPRTAELRTRLKGMGVFLIVLDAARAREFTTYGYPRSTTLEIDRLAREGVVFEQAVTPAPYTDSAMSSVWTSLYHDQHHYGVYFRGVLPAAHLTLAEVLTANGVPTAGFAANPFGGAAFGLDRGFAYFRVVRGAQFRSRVQAEGVVAAVRAHLDHMGNRPSFTYVHFLEPHFPYDQPEPFVTMFGPDAPLSREERESTDWITEVNRGRRALTPEERQHLVRLYDGNLAYGDRQVGQLRRMLEERGLLERVVIVVMADHGDELYERGQIGHGGRLYEEVLHIPLIIRFPKGAGPVGLRVRTPVDLLDLAPTILDIMGLAGAGGSDRVFEGRSLLPVLFGGQGKPLLFGRTMYERPTYSVRDWPWKLIHSVRSGQTELYQLADDPGEAKSLANAEPVRAEFYRQTLYRWLRGLRKTRGANVEPRLSPEDRETLRALGYIK